METEQLCRCDGLGHVWYSALAFQSIVRTSQSQCLDMNMEIGGVWPLICMYLCVYFRAKEVLFQVACYHSEVLPVESMSCCLCFLPVSSSSHVFNNLYQTNKIKWTNVLKYTVFKEQSSFPTNGHHMTEALDFLNH